MGRYVHTAHGRYDIWVSTCIQPMPFDEWFPQEDIQTPVVAGAEAVGIDVVGGSI